MTLMPRPTVSISAFETLNAELHEKMFLPVGQSDAKPSVFSSEASSILIYRPTELMKGLVDPFQPGVEPLTCSMEAQYATTQPLVFIHEKFAEFHW
ncbi:hypothetical protein TNCV_2204481 [Trichonephila clavipes]|nr:hypothetical protein TNCV_2204481 [Trichonephila clavipes]